MKAEIRHRRLHAFYQSKVLNSLMVVGIVFLLQMGYMEPVILPVVCASTTLGLFIVYSLWLWIKKPRRIMINSWISVINSWFTIYFLIVLAMKDNASLWWHVSPAVAAIIMFFINMVKPRDELYYI